MIENGKIYKFTNLINGKIYIGQTKQTLEQRLNKHKSQINDNTYFHRALKKYGLDNFSYELIEDNIIFKDLDEKEKYWIKYYDSYYTNGKGYNMTFGGQWGNPYFKLTPVQADEIKKLITETNLTFEQIGERYQVTLYCISDINRGCSFNEPNIEYPLRKSPKRSQLNEEKVNLIIDMLYHSSLSIEDIALSTNVKSYTVGEINRGKNSWCPIDIDYPIRKPIQKNTYQNILNQDEVKKIIYDLLFTSLTQSQIGEKYKVAKNTIGDISRGISWKEITNQFVCPIKTNKIENQKIYYSIYGIV